MKQGPGGDNLAVQWQLPDGSIQSPIPGQFLSPAQSGNLRLAASDLLLSAQTETELEPTEPTLTSELSVYPNPVTEISHVVFTLPQDVPVMLVLYNNAGQPVSKLFNGPVKANSQIHLPLPVEQLTQGTYFIRLSGGKHNLSKKIVVLK
jgi:hypothetical protein